MTTTTTLNILQHRSSDKMAYLSDLPGFLTPDLNENLPFKDQLLDWQHIRYLEGILGIDDIRPSEVRLITNKPKAEYQEERQQFLDAWGRRIDLRYQRSILRDYYAHRAQLALGKTEEDKKKRKRVRSSRYSNNEGSDMADSNSDEDSSGSTTRARRTKRSKKSTNRDNARALNHAMKIARLEEQLESTTRELAAMRERKSDQQDQTLEHKKQLEAEASESEQKGHDLHESVAPGAQHDRDMLAMGQYAPMASGHVFTTEMGRMVEDFRDLSIRDDQTVSTVEGDRKRVRRE